MNNTNHRDILEKHQWFFCQAEASHVVRGACRAQDGASPTEDSPAAAAVSRGSAGAGPVALLLCWGCPCPTSAHVRRLSGSADFVQTVRMRRCLSSSVSYASALPLMLILCLLLCNLCPVSHTLPLILCLLLCRRHTLLCLYQIKLNVLCLSSSASPPLHASPILYLMSPILAIHGHRMRSLVLVRRWNW